MSEDVRDPKLNIYQRLHAVMGEIDYVQKDKKAGMQYSIVSHDKVTGLVRPLMHKHGIIYNISEITHGQDGNRTWVKCTVRFINVDPPNESLYVESFGYGVDPGDKGPGKAMSYAVKYALLKTLGLETGDHPDVSGDPDEVQDERANHIKQADLGSIKGEGPVRFASNVPYDHLEKELLRNDNPSDINLWWVQNKPTREKQLNSEHRWFLFLSMVRHGLAHAVDPEELKGFWITHTTELKELARRNKSEYDGLCDYKDKAKGRFQLNG